MKRHLRKALVIFLMGVSPAFAAAMTPATMYKNPGCGCCDEHAKHLKANGIDVKIVETPDLVKMQQQAGISSELAGCHLVKIDGYVFDGHVPAADVKRFLKEKPKDAKGLAVPGMPAGSPGMGGKKTAPLKVYSINNDKTPKLYATH